MNPAPPVTKKCMALLWLSRDEGQSSKEETNTSNERPDAMLLDKQYNLLSHMGQKVVLLISRKNGW
jgi:hypothetical protein